MASWRLKTKLPVELDAELNLSRIKNFRSLRKSVDRFANIVRCYHARNSNRAEVEIRAVEQVEYLTDQLESEAIHVNVLCKPQIHLEERAAASIVAWHVAWTIIGRITERVVWTKVRPIVTTESIVVVVRIDDEIHGNSRSRADDRTNLESFRELIHTAERKYVALIVRSRTLFTAEIILIVWLGHTEEIRRVLRNFR